MNEPLLITVNGHTPHIDPDAFIAPGVVLAGNITVGAGASIWFGSVLRAEDAPIAIGEGANLQDMTIVHTDPGVPATIGAEAVLGHRATVHGATIGDGALVGVGSVVLNHAVVGPAALVAAGAVVTERAVVEARALVAGVPARRVREVTDEAVAGFLRIAESYRERARLYRTALGR